VLFPPFFSDFAPFSRPVCFLVNLSPSSASVTLVTLWRTPATLIFFPRRFFNFSLRPVVFWFFPCLPNFLVYVGHDFLQASRFFHGYLPRSCMALPPSLKTPRLRQGFFCVPFFSSVHVGRALSETAPATSLSFSGFPPFCCTRAPIPHPHFLQPRGLEHVSAGPGFFFFSNLNPACTGFPAICWFLFFFLDGPLVSITPKFDVRALIELFPFCVSIWPSASVSNPAFLRPYIYGHLMMPPPFRLPHLTSPIFLHFGPALFPFADLRALILEFCPQHPSFQVRPFPSVLPFAPWPLVARKGLMRDQRSFPFVIPAPPPGHVPESSPTLPRECFRGHTPCTALLCPPPCAMPTPS